MVVIVWLLVAYGLPEPVITAFSGRQDCEEVRAQIKEQVPVALHCVPARMLTEPV